MRSALPWIAAAALTLAASAARAFSPAVVTPRGPGHVAIAWEAAGVTPTELVVRSSTATPAAVHAHVVTGRDGIVRADVAGLEPGALYRYDAGDGRVGRFLAPPDAGQPLRFVVFGDPRSGDDVHQRLIDRVAALAPDLYVTTGDLVGDGASPDAWTRFFAIERGALASAMFATVRGNHDGDERFGRLAALRSDAPGAGVTYGAFDAGASHFLMIDTELSVAPGSEQYGYARRDLEAHRGRGPLFVLMHKPLFSTGRHGGTPAIHDALGPLFQQYGVDIVFQGHDHDYERTRPINGVTYIVTGGGGAMLFGAAGGPWTVVNESAHHFVVVDASATRVRVAAQRLDGSELDAFELDPRANDTAPATLAAAPLPPPGGGGCAMIFLGRGRHTSDARTPRGGSLVAGVPVVGLVLARRRRRKGR